ncbi:MAG: sigma-54-dependent Fis family transcriptional regulator, partial [Deltaproteobacteria bacterium]|nr:sigma-54-dependent Fis family transcriptional regulator [Deltaproteobacteria bacterium]
MIDENEFFRNATLKICGNLQMEQALYETLLFLREHIPIDELYAQYFDPGLGMVRTLAHADVTGGKRIELVAPTPYGKPEDAELHAAAILGQAVVLNHPDENCVATALLRYHNRDETAMSIITLRTVCEGGLFGGLVAFANHRDAFTDEHGQLMTLLAEPFKVALVNAVQHGDLVRLKDRLADDNQYLHRELRKTVSDEIVGSDFGLKNLMRMVYQVAPTESPVLLMGETGVGKDVVANAIHLSSSRRDGPFIPVNCGAIPDSLLDSELFGHEKGAFTGALAQKRGRFERADKGTVLLDEIGEMPLEAQVRLLRVLQNREIERIGGTKSISLDIRIIAATNKNLEEEVKAGRFREDLFFRLNVFPIVVPPLRERMSDIPAFVQHFLGRKAKELKVGDTPRLAEGAIDVLLGYNWPGNVRELENIIERAMILHRDEPLRFDDLAASSPRPTANGSSANDSQSLELDEVNAKHITRVL